MIFLEIETVDLNRPKDPSKLRTLRIPDMGTQKSTRPC